MLFFGASTKTIATNLSMVSDSFVPAVKHSQTTLANFDKELKLLQDAVIMGEVENVQEAAKISDIVIQSIAQITNAEDLSTTRKEEARLLQQAPCYLQSNGHYNLYKNGRWRHGR